MLHFHEYTDCTGILLLASEYILVCYCYFVYNIFCKIKILFKTDIGVSSVPVISLC